MIIPQVCRFQGSNWALVYGYIVYGYTGIYPNIKYSIFSLATLAKIVSLLNCISYPYIKYRVIFSLATLARIVPLLNCISRAKRAKKYMRYISVYYIWYIGTSIWILWYILVGIGVWVLGKCMRYIGKLVDCSYLYRCMYIGTE